MIDVYGFPLKMTDADLAYNTHTTVDLCLTDPDADRELTKIDKTEEASDEEEEEGRRFI